MFKFRKNVAAHRIVAELRELRRRGGDRPAGRGGGELVGPDLPEARADEDAEGGVPASPSGSCWPGRPTRGGEVKS